LSGRDETQILRTAPTDHCRLGVLGPRDPDVDQPEPQDENTESGGDADGEVNDTVPAGTKVHQGTRTGGAENADRADDSGDEDPEAFGETFAEAEQVISERRGSSQDPTRRPPSSLGFEIVAESENDALEIRVSGSFAVYTQRFPTFDEQRRQMGDVETDRDGPGGHSGSRDRVVSLLEAYTRRVVQIPPIMLRVDPDRLPVRLTDGGVVQQELDSVLDAAVSEPDFRREISGYATVPVRVLDSPESYQRHLRRVATGTPMRPPLRASLDVRLGLAQQDGGIRIRCYLRNDTPQNPEHRSDDQRHVLADVMLEGELLRGTLRPVELLPVAEDY
jgi:hypothetical protein